MNLSYTNWLANPLKVIFLLAIFTVSVLIALNSALINNPLVASAVTFDLIISLPLAYYFCIRKTKLSKRTVIPLITFGFVTASLILPDGNRQFLELLTSFALPVFEIGVVGYVIYLAYKSRKTFQELGANKDFLERLRETLRTEFSNGFAAKALTFELSGLYYAFFKWKKQPSNSSFTYHQQNGFFALIAAFGFILTIEIFVLHFLVAKWSEIFAWILTASSIYFLFQICAHCKAVFLRPTEIIGEKLFIRCGLFGDAELKLDNIESIEITGSPVELEKNEQKITPLGNFTESNIKISVTDQAGLNGFYGRMKNFQTLYFYLDDPLILKNEIEKYKRGR